MTALIWYCTFGTVLKERKRGEFIVTRNLKWYAGFAIVWSTAFFAALDWGLAQPRERFLAIIGASVLYGAGFWVMGYALGRDDDQSAVRYDLRRAYSAVSNIASAAVGTVWILGFQRSGMPGIPIYLGGVALFWTLGALQARKSIKGMPAEELFQ